LFGGFHPNSFINTAKLLTLFYLVSLNTESNGSVPKKYVCWTAAFRINTEAGFYAVVFFAIKPKMFFWVLSLEPADYADFSRRGFLVTKKCSLICGKNMGIPTPV
jgi:hypothetical protein